MELIRSRSVIDAPGDADLSVSITMRDNGFSWSIANRGRRPVPIRSVAVAHTIRGLLGRLRMFRHGYQSWSQTSLAVTGIDTDPSLTDGTLDVVVMTHHADGKRPRPGRLRSELVTVLADDHDAILIGFLGGDRHDGTLWVGSGRSGNELLVQAFLGDVVLGQGEQFDLHDVIIEATDDPAGALDAWATECGRRNSARVDAPYQVGWCSWYQYFEHIDAKAFAHNLGRSGDWPFDVFQLDDGYQSEIGDWTTTNEKFPRGLAALAESVHDTGLTPGLWLAPFVAAERSTVYQRHPDWIARTDEGEALVGMYNEHWGGFVEVLDTSHPAVLEHLESTAAELASMGFGYLKLDFAYAPSFDGRYHDPTMTPAQRVRAGLDAIRRGAGEDTFLLGCGAPLGPCIGVVDGMRIGADVAPWWEPKPHLWPFPGYDATLPSTLNAWRNTLSRSFQHRRLWLNDPDCLMLGTETDLNEEQIRAWASCVAVSGGMALVSDDLGALDANARRRLDQVLEVGRRVDAAAVDGPAPRCEDLMETATPGVLVADGLRLEGTPRSGTARITRA